MADDDDRQDSGIPTQFDRKATDRAFMLPLLGCLLLLPPLAGIFQLDLRVFGIPFTAVYLFVVWGVLIAGAALLARPLRDQAGWSDAETGREKRRD